MRLKLIERGLIPDSATTEVNPLIARLRQAIDRDEWKGKGGATDYAVLLAFVEIMAGCHKIEYGASVREVGERASVSYETASKSIKRLIKRGWLARVEAAHCEQSASVTFQK